MTLTFEQAGAKLKQVGTALPKAQQSALKKSATTATELFDATGGRMRNYRKGTDLVARARITPEQAQIKPRQVGAWHIAESGAGPHLIGIAARGRRGRRATGYVHAAGYDHPVRGPIAHPGAKGRHVWTKATVLAERAVPPVFDRIVVGESLRKVF